MDNSIDIEVGDLFVITRKGKYRNRPCPYADKVFVVKSFTTDNLSVHYDDGRTNIRCKCINCIKAYVMRYDKEGNWVKMEVPRMISVDQIKVVEKRLERERDIKIKLLGL